MVWLYARHQSINLGILVLDYINIYTLLSEIEYNMHK